MTYRQGCYSLKVNNSAGIEADVLARLVECWHTCYARMALRFNPQAKRSLHLHIDPTYNGAGETLGGRITVSASYIVTHPWDSDVMTHELFHVVQAYPSWDCTLWAMEGLADYARYRYGLYNAQGGWSLPEFTPAHSFADSYRVTARFFVWLENHHSTTVLEALDHSLRKRTYRDRFWKERFGRSLEQLWSEYAANPQL